MVRFVAALLCAAAVAAAADVPEIPVSAPKLVVQPQSPLIAVGKTRRYAVWSDHFIYGMELTADGKPRLETRTKIADALYVLQLFAVDDQFYVVYTNGTTPVFSRCIDTGATRETAYDARLTTNGSRLLERYSTASGEQGVLLSRDLVPVSNPFNLDSPGPYWLEMSAVNGTFFMLAADRNGNAHGKLIDNDGHVTDLGPLLRLGQIASPHLATDGGAYLLVWQPNSYAVFARYITAGGDVTGDLIVIAQAKTPVIDFASVAWSGSDYVVAWHDSSASSLSIRHVSGGTAGPTVQVAAPVLAGGVIGGPAGTFALWSVNATPNSGIITVGPAYAQRLDVADDPDPISYGVPQQNESAVAADAGQSAVVWSEADEVRLGRFDAHRAPLDGDGIAVAAVAYARSPRIAGNGVDYLVTWISGPQLFGRLVTRDGNFAGDAFAISAATLPYGTDTDVAWDGSRFLVSWDSGLASVTPGGTVAPLLYTTGDGTPSVPRYSGGPRPLLVNARTVQGVATIVSGVFLDNGTTFDLARELTLNPPNKVLLSNAHAASNGRDYLVTWSRANDATHFSEAWMARVDSGGKIIAGPIVAANASTSASKAQAIPLFDGADYRVVVHGDAHPLAEAVVSDATFACGCLDALDLPFDVGPTPTFGRLAAAAGGRGQAAISYDRLVIDPFIAYRERVFLRLLGYPAPRHRAAGK